MIIGKSVMVRCSRCCYSAASHARGARLAHARAHSACCTYLVLRTGWRNLSHTHSTRTRCVHMERWAVILIGADRTPPLGKNEYDFRQITVAIKAQVT
jgi:hypothetical protein